MADGGARPAVTEQGKLLALLSYGSFFAGLPLGVIPLVQRDDPFSLFHAKHATAVWIVNFVLMFVLVMVYSVLSFVTCGFGALLFPIVLLPIPWSLIVSIHGLILSINGEYQEPMGAFGLGDLMFGQLQVKETVSLPPPPPPSDGPPPPPPTMPPPV